MSLRVLLVEDNRLNADLARDLLEAEGHAVAVAIDAAAFRGSLKASDPPDVILMDILLPDGDGITLLGEARGDPRYRRIPTIALTAQALAGDASRFQAAGFDAVLTKPIDTRTFVASVERCARGSTIASGD